MSGDWLKSSIAELIRAYRAQENLYNQKHKLYYNKQARLNSMNKILDAVKKNRPETTPADVTKKIQTLRTQYGQEVNKIEKSISLGEDLIYNPKIWWFHHINWIGDFMKTRTDKTPLSARAKTAKTDKSTSELFEFDDEIDDTNEQCYATIELSEYEVQEAVAESEPPEKKPRTFQKPIRNKLSTNKQEEGVRTIEYTLINEDTNTEVIPTATEERLPEYVEYQETEVAKASDKYKRRSKTFGKFIGALMQEITDDRIFFELQQSITKSIHEASVKQQGTKKS